MKRDDDRPHPATGRAGLVFAYFSFLIAIGMIGTAIYILPLAFKVKVFLAAASLLLTSLFVFMALLSHLVMRAHVPKSAVTKRSDGDPD